MNVLLMLPVALPLAATAIMLLFYGHGPAQRLMGVGSSMLQLVAAVALLHAVHSGGVQTTLSGGWPAPFGISFVADGFSALLILLSGIIALTVAVYSVWNIDVDRRDFGFYPLMQVLLMGANGAFLTGDLFNLYVWIEVLLIASFVLLVLGNERRQMEGALKYVTLNIISSILFLTAIGILYGSVGALNMADVALKLPDLPPSLTKTLAMLFLVAFGIKAAVFPLFFWLPDTYHTPPPAVTALFAGLLTKVGVYAMMRVFMLLFHEILDEQQVLFLLIAAFTMAVGVLGAVAQAEVRRILAFHSVSQIGYMVMGLALFTTASLAGAIYFILHHSIVKSNLFLISGAVQRHGGSTQLKLIGDLMRRAPLLAVLFMVTALSLAGLPPLTGFWAKFALVQAGLELGGPGAYAVIATSLAVSVFTLISMVKIWNEAFWKPAPEEMAATPAPTRPTEAGLIFVPIIALTVLTVITGLMPEPLLAMTRTAAEQLMDRQGYINAVLGGTLP